MKAQRHRPVLIVDEVPVDFANRRRQRLAGVLHLPRGKARVPALIMAHGFTDDKTGDNRLFVTFARWISRRGVAVLRFDFAGSGDSAGAFSGMTVDSEISDLRCAVDFACAHPHIDVSRIGLVGYSLGGAVSLLAMARDQRIKSFVGWAPAACLVPTFRRVLGAGAFRRARTERLIACRNGDKEFFLGKAFFDSIRRHDPLLRVPLVSPRPILIIQGLADAKVLPRDARRLFRAAAAPKALHCIAGAGHSFAYHERELFGTTWQYVRTWCARSV